MLNFHFYTPTQVVFGKDAEEETGGLVRQFGGQKVLLHYGGKSAKESGLLDRVCRTLEQEGISYVQLGGVKPNPRLSLVREGIDLCRREGVDFILAVGGGSVIDSAKAIGYGLENDCDVWDIFTRKTLPTGCTPIGAVLTIAAAGSEMSDSAVITNEDGWVKRGFNSNYARCRFAVMNPELTYTVSPYQTAAGCTDILMHTFERYFTPVTDAALTDALGEALVRTVIECSRVVMREPRDYNARAQIMWAGSLSHNGLTGCGTLGDWATHQLGHELSAQYDVAHGASLAAVWGSWARYVMGENPARFAQFAVNVMGVSPRGSEEETGRLGILSFEEFLRGIGMPVSIREMGIEADYTVAKELAYGCSFQETRTIGTFRKLGLKDMEAIYLMAK